MATQRSHIAYRFLEALNNTFAINDVFWLCYLAYKQENEGEKPLTKRLSPIVQSELGITEYKIALRCNQKLSWQKLSIFGTDNLGMHFSIMPHQYIREKAFEELMSEKLHREASEKIKQVMGVSKGMPL